MTEPRVCGYCNERPAVYGTGICGGCVWPVRNEVVVGLRQIETSLRRHADFDAWCDTESARAEPTPTIEGASPAGRAD